MRRIAAVGVVEMLGVVGGGLAGLLIVNVMPKEQYAQYTFLFASMTLLLGVTDLGLAYCSLPVVGERARELPWVTGAVQRVFHWRWALLGVGMLVVVPYFVYATWEHRWSGAPYWAAALLFGGLVLTTLREHYASTVLVILGHVPTLNKIGLKSTIIRLSLVGLVLLLPTGSFTITGIAAATALTSVWNVLLYRQALRRHEVAETRLEPETARGVDRDILRIARPLVIPGIFFQIQGVFTVMLVSLFGTANMLAEVGAFGRLAMVLQVVDRVTGVLLFPAIARAPSGPRLVSTIVRVHALYLLCIGCVLVTAFWLPQYWIILLGSQYRSMTPYVWMVFLASMLMNASGLAFRTLTVRGTTSRQSYGVAVIVAVQVLYLWAYGVGSLPAVLGFNLATSLAHAGYQYLMLVLRLPEWRREKAAAVPAQAAVEPMAK